MAGVDPPPGDDLAAWAVHYADLGWHVFPCQPGGKPPATPRGLHDATTDLLQVLAWWGEDPAFNIGLSCGPSGLVVLDVDGEEGAASLTALQPAPPPTLISETGGGGAHFVYAVPPGEAARSTAGRLGRGLDTRGDGGYIILPPSLHPSGRRYRWAPWRDPRDVAPAPAPRYLLSSPPPPRRPPAPDARPRFDGGEGTPWGLAGLRGELDRLLAARPGTRNTTLNEVAHRVGRLIGGGQLEEGAARSALEATARQLWEATGDRASDREITATADSGISAGKLAPAVPPPVDRGPPRA